MKTHNKILTVTFASCLAAIGLFFNGCATPQVTSVQQPVVTETTSTNTDGQVQTVTQTNFVTILQTNYVPNTTVTQLASSAPTAATIVGAAVPQPYGGIFALVIGLLGILGTGITGAIASAKNALANQHASTIQAMGVGIENALPSIQQALTTTAASGVTPANAAGALTTANAVLSAIKGSISTSTTANGTAANLSSQLAVIGAGPHSPT